jgi:hypothetical protein
MSYNHIKEYNSGSLSSIDKKQIFYFSPLQNKTKLPKKTTRICKDLIMIKDYRPKTGFSSQFRTSAYPKVYFNSFVDHNPEPVSQKIFRKPKNPKAGKSSDLIFKSPIKPNLPSYGSVHKAHVSKKTHETGCSCCTKRLSEVGSIEKLLTKSFLENNRDHRPLRNPFSNGKNLKSVSRIYDYVQNYDVNKKLATNRNQNDLI